MERNIRSIDGKDLNWVECKDENGVKIKLICTVVIAGCEMHLEAFEAVWEDGVQAFNEFTPGEVYDAVGGDGPWETTEIKGREYVLIATPYCT